MGKMVKTGGIVLSQYNIAEDIYDLTLGCGEVARAGRPGQFVSLYCADRSRVLPRPISLCDADPQAGTIRLVYRRAGAGTDEFSHLLPGDSVELMGPLGNGYPAVPEEVREIWLLGGGIGIPPMLLLARELTLKKSGASVEEAFGAKTGGEGRQVHVILGFRDTLFLNHDFDRIPGVQLHIATENGSSGAKGNVMDALPAGRPDMICACGPTPMLRAVRGYALEQGISCYLSLEQRMACGIGACLACVCASAGTDEHSQVKNKRVCAEGPVFDAREIVL